MPGLPKTTDLLRKRPVRLRFCCGGKMERVFARVEMFNADPDQMDELLTDQHKAVGLVRTMAGNMGGYVLVNRDVGRLLNVTFWQSEDEREAAERELASGPSRGEVIEYAVAMQQALG
jgi:hypothetical protein